MTHLLRHYGKLILLFAAILALSLAGCGSDDEPADDDGGNQDVSPVITLDAATVADGATLTEGDAFRLAFTAEKGPHGENLLSVQVNEYINNGSESLTVLDTTGLDSETFSFDAGELTAYLALGETTEYRMEIIVSDQANNVASRNISFTVEQEEEPVDPEAPKVFTAVFTNTNAFMASAEANPVPVDEPTADGNKANIDLTYLYSNDTDSYSFISPAVRSNEALYDEFSIDNYPQNTQFIVVGTSPERFEELKRLNKSEIGPEFEMRYGSEWPGNPDGARIGGENPVGDVYGFYTPNGSQTGLIHVVSVSGDQMTVEIMTTQ